MLCPQLLLQFYDDFFFFLVVYGGFLIVRGHKYTEFACLC